MTGTTFTAVNFLSPFGRGAPKRGAGIGGTWSRGPLAGCDRGADQGRVVQCRSHARLGGQIPEGPSSAPRRAPVSGDATVKAHVSTRANAAPHPAPGSHPSTIRLEPAPPSAGARGEGSSGIRHFCDARRAPRGSDRDLQAVVGTGDTQRVVPARDLLEAEGLLQHRGDLLVVVDRLVVIHAEVLRARELAHFDADDVA